MLNPFAEIAQIIPPGMMQTYVVLMILFVIGGTVLDMWHKKSAKYFFANAEKAKANAKNTLSSGEKRSLAIQTVTNEVLTSAEFKNPQRRMSHLLSMYGFILFVVSTAVMIFGYGAEASAGIWPVLWHLGALMLAAGGYWFWFAIRVDVAAEGNAWYRVARTDLFILSLLAMATFALLWSFTGSMFMFALFIAASTVLFTTVLWSKFAHMFFKPAAAYQKKTVWAEGSRENLPDMPELDDPAIQAKFPDIPTYMGKNPPNMGLGIKRESARHY